MKRRKILHSDHPDERQNISVALVCSSLQLFIRKNENSAYARSKANKQKNKTEKTENEKEINRKKKLRMKENEKKRN